MIQHLIELVNKPEYLWSMSDKIIFDVYIVVVCIIGFAIIIGGYWIISKIIDWWRKHIHNQDNGKDDD